MAGADGGLETPPGIQESCLKLGRSSAQPAGPVQRVLKNLAARQALISWLCGRDRGKCEAGQSAAETSFRRGSGFRLHEDVTTVV